MKRLCGNNISFCLKKKVPFATVKHKHKLEQRTDTLKTYKHYEQVLDAFRSKNETHFYIANEIKIDVSEKERIES